MNWREKLLKDAVDFTDDLSINGKVTRDIKADDKQHLKLYQLGRKEREDEIIKIIDKWFVTDAKGLTITNLIKLVEQIKEQKEQ